MKTMDQELRDRFTRAFVTGMRQSYPSLTVESVRQKLDAILDGEQGKDIISLFLVKDLAAHGYIEESDD